MDDRQTDIQTMPIHYFSGDENLEVYLKGIIGKPMKYRKILLELLEGSEPGCEDPVSEGQVRFELASRGLPLYHLFQGLLDVHLKYSFMRN